VSYLVDTNVVAELARRKPDSRVVAWFRDVPDPALHLSVLTLGALRKGVESLAEARRKERLRVWLEHDLAEWFGERLLPLKDPPEQGRGALHRPGQHPPG